MVSGWWSRWTKTDTVGVLQYATCLYSVVYIHIGIIQTGRYGGTYTSYVTASWHWAIARYPDRSAWQKLIINLGNHKRNKTRNTGEMITSHFTINSLYLWPENRFTAFPVNDFIWPDANYVFGVNNGHVLVLGVRSGEGQCCSLRLFCTKLIFTILPLIDLWIILIFGLRLMYLMGKIFENGKKYNLFLKYSTLLEYCDLCIFSRARLPIFHRKNVGNKKKCF